MKKQEIQDVIYCDVCGKKEGSYSHACLGCGVHVCYECMKAGSMVDYPPGVHHSGSDGYFCNKCDANPPEKVVALHAAFRKIVALRAEYEKWWKEFDNRGNAAETEVKRLQADCEKN